MFQYYLLVIFCASLLMMSGCNVIAFGGAMAQVQEDQMLIEKYAEYD